MFGWDISWLLRGCKLKHASRRRRMVLQIFRYLATMCTYQGLGDQGCAGCLALTLGASNTAAWMTSKLSSAAHSRLSRAASPSISCPATCMCCSAVSQCKPCSRTKAARSGRRRRPPAHEAAQLVDTKPITGRRVSWIIVSWRASIKRLSDQCA